MKILYFLYFCGSFFPSWIRIRIQQLKLMQIHADPDPDTDPDPKPCLPSSCLYPVWLGWPHKISPISRVSWVSPSLVKNEIKDARRRAVHKRIYPRDLLGRSADQIVIVRSIFYYLRDQWVRVPVRSCLQRKIEVDQKLPTRSVEL